jgi:peroxin-14
MDKRIAFLQSKNLTQEEINVAMARAGTPIGPPGSAPVQVSMPQGQAGPVGAYGPPPGYGAYPGYWPPPPPE